MRTVRGCYRKIHHSIGHILLCFQDIAIPFIIESGGQFLLTDDAPKSFCSIIQSCASSQSQLPGTVAVLLDGTATVYGFFVFHCQNVFASKHIVPVVSVC